MKTLTTGLLFIAAVTLCGCSPKTEPTTEAPVSEEPVAAAPAVTLSPEEIIAKSIAEIPDRPAGDAARDAGRKPTEVLAFLGLQPGMTVLDVFAAGGWYSEVLSSAVGPAGRVIIQNPPRLLAVRDGVYDKELTARLEADRLGNVERIDKNINELGLDMASIDLAITALNFHDMYYLVSPEAAAGHLAAIHAMLRPGAVLGIIDHYGAADSDNADLHRIDPQMVKDMASAAGFVVEAQSGILHNHNDDMSLNVFDPAIKGKTHRFVLRLRKP